MASSREKHDCDIGEFPLPLIEERIATLTEQTLRLHTLASELGDTPEGREYRKLAEDTNEKKRLLWHAMHERKGTGGWQSNGGYSDQRAASGSSSNHNNINNDASRPWHIAVSVTALVMAVVSMGGLWWTAKEFKQVQIQLMYQNALMLREGIVKPGDEVYGPEGNLLYRNHELKPKER
jgi:hypothetical protein